MSKIISHPYKFQLIPAGQIKVNALYQRPLDFSRIKRLVQKFDWHLVNCVKVVWRDGEWYAIDGQHTTAMLLTKFGPDYLVPCLVYDDLSNWFEEAKAFIKGNDRDLRKVLGLRDEWKARLFGNDEKASDIKRICNNNKLKIPTSRGESGNGWIGAVAALEKQYDILGPVKFNEMLYIISCAWDGKKDSLLAPILNGMGQFVNVYFGEYDRAALIKRLNHTDPTLIIRAGKASAAQGHTKYAREILSVYNKKTTVNKLPDKL